MHWIPVIAWIAAAAIAVVVLGFTGYEVAWKSARLRRDVERLQQLNERLTALRDSLATAQQRIASSGLR